MDAETLELFERSLAHAAEQHTGPALDAALDELGWTEALASDPQAAISSWFGLQGATTVTSTALERVVGHGLGLDGSSPDGLLVLPAFGSAAPPGRWARALLQVDGLAVDASAVDGLVANGSAIVLVVADGPEGPAVVEVEAAGLERHPIGGLDPDLGLARVTGQVQAGAGVPGDWETAVARARLAVGHELVGASRTMLELARHHALERVQFGRPIGGFQAVRHRLAETLVAIEMAEALLEAAWLDASPATAAMAKAVAGRSARTTARHCQQVLAGIGFTTEHPLHRSVRRTLVLDGLFATSRSLTRDLGTELLERRRLPPLLPL